MIKTGLKRSKLCYILLLIAGFCGLGILGCPNLSWISGVAASVWILAYLGLVCSFRRKRQLIISAVVFCAGYLLRFASAVDIIWLYFALFPIMSMVLYGIFLLYAYILKRWNHLVTTLAFPVIWTAVYGIATLIRFPTLIRVDVLFVNFNVFIQAENVLSAVGLSFIVLWVLALIHYAISNRNPVAGAIGAGLYLAALFIGIVYLYPNVTYTDFVKVAYTTGPYVGDYMKYESLPTDTYLSNIENSAREAMESDADILMFNEEAFEIDAEEEEYFLYRCSEVAAENGIHLLVGLDINNSSKNAKNSNKIVWIDSNGDILGSCVKTKMIPVLESDYRSGDGEIPSHTIMVRGKPVKVSYLICYDSNFPAYVSKIDDETDILFLPSWDWKAVTELHSKLCCTLAVENRVSIVKCTYDGISIAVNPDGKIIHSTDTDKVGFGQIHVADIPYDGEQGLIVEKHETSAYVYGIIAVEIMSMLLCLILLHGVLWESREKSARSRIFSVLVFTCLVALGADALSWKLDGSLRLIPVLYATTIISMVLTFVLTGEFIFYIVEYIKERRHISNAFRIAYMVFAVAAMVIIIVCSITGKLFFFEDGLYTEGPWYSIYVIINIAAVLFSMFVFVLYGKSLTGHDIIATSLYVIIPSGAAIINLFVPEFSYAYPATTLSLVVLYVMIQSERVGQLKKDKQESSHMASHDELTGLLNRRAFDDRISSLSDSEEPAGVIFADVNGLKYTNDNYGHEAGDNFLSSFAEILSDYFRKDEIFRISGDEFVVIMQGVPQQFFEQRTAKFERNLDIDGFLIACIGVEYGKGKEIPELLHEAETHMYAKKDEYHKLHPEIKRF